MAKRIKAEVTFSARNKGTYHLSGMPSLVTHLDLDGDGVEYQVEAFFDDGVLECAVIVSEVVSRKWTSFGTWSRKHGPTPHNGELLTDEELEAHREDLEQECAERDQQSRDEYERDCREGCQ